LLAQIPGKYYPPFKSITVFVLIRLYVFALLISSMIFIQKRIMEEEIQIDPRLEDGGLMFHFAPPSHVLDVSKDSNSYQFIHCMLDKIMKGYDDNPEKIGFIGGRAMIEYALIYMLDSFNKYQDNVLMSDLFPYPRHAKI
jgi:hypothetical protein